MLMKYFLNLWGLPVLTALALTCAAQAAPPNWPEQAPGASAVKRTQYTTGRRPAGCPREWCACWYALKFLGLSPQESRKRGLWRARAMARLGSPAPGPAPGVTVIYARGKRGGHVGRVVRVVDRDTIVVLSANDSGAVRVRERSTRGVIAWRWIEGAS